MFLQKFLFQIFNEGKNEITSRLIFHRLRLDEFYRHRVHDWHGCVFSPIVFIGQRHQNVNG